FSGEGVRLLLDIGIQLLELGDVRLGVGGVGIGVIRVDPGERLGEVGHGVDGVFDVEPDMHLVAVLMVVTVIDVIVTVMVVVVRLIVPIVGIVVVMGGVVLALVVGDGGAERLVAGCVAARGLHEVVEPGLEVVSG